MKIVFLTDSLSNKGGASRIILESMKKFTEEAHEVFVIETTQHKAKAGRRDNIYTIYVPPYHERWRAYLSVFNPTAVKQVRTIMKEIQPDISHAHNVHYYLSYGSLKVAKRWSKKVFLTAHDVMLFHYGKFIEFANTPASLSTSFDYKVHAWQHIKRFRKRYNPFRNILIRHYLKYVNTIFAVSQALRTACAQNGIQNVQILYSGIDVRDWFADSRATENFKKEYNLRDEKIILFAGRINELKGGNVLVQALASVVKKMPRVTLLILAEPDSADSIRRLSTVQHVEKNIVYAGWLSGDRLKAAYHASDLVVVPSICFDSFPTVNLEAFACKKPVVATCFGGSKELVEDGVDGYIVNPNNTELLTERIITLLSNPAQALAFGEHGYEKVRTTFSLESQYKQLLKIYTES